jgi:SAM-dependent methyltransferase
MGEANETLDGGGTCVACGAMCVSRWCVRQNAHGTFTVYRCSSCGTGFVWPRPSDAFLLSYYRELPDAEPATLEQLLAAEESYPNAMVDAARICEICARESVGSRFLDVGAGTGFFSRAALDRGFRVTACEPHSASRAVFRRMNGFEPHATFLDDAFADGHASRFDVVLLSQVLEHVRDPAGFIRNAAKVLEPGGLIAIAVPHFGSALSRVQGTRDMFVTPPEHLSYFTRKGLETLLRHHGFEIRRRETVSRIDAARVARRIPLPFFAWHVVKCVHWVLRASDPFGWGTILRIYASKQVVEQIDSPAPAEPVASDKECEPCASS